MAGDELGDLADVYLDEAASNDRGEHPRTIRAHALAVDPLLQASRKRHHHDTVPGGGAAAASPYTSNP
jgi:hypothetical protein